MRVDASNHRCSKDATEPTVMGPFYAQNPPEAAFGADIRGAAKGDPLYIDGSIFSEDGKPVANAIVDVWHSDAEGFYDVQLPELQEPTLRARFHSDAQGRFRFWTIMPKYYPIPDDGTVGEMLKASARHPYRPAHVHFMIVADWHPTLVTDVFVDGDQYLDSDAVFCRSPRRRASYCNTPVPARNTGPLPGSCSRPPSSFPCRNGRCPNDCRRPSSRRTTWRLSVPPLSVSRIAIERVGLSSS